MRQTQAIVTRLIKIKIVQYREGNLLVALSDDLKGFMVSGRSDDEIARKVPDAIREILEAQGNKVISVTTESDIDNLPLTFMARDFIAIANIEAVL